MMLLVISEYEWVKAFKLRLLSKSIYPGYLLIKSKYNKVYIYDEVANIENTRDKKIILLNKLKKNSFDVIILAVPHKEIVSKGIKKIKSYLKQKNIFLDLKGYFDKRHSNFRLWLKIKT